MLTTCEMICVMRYVVEVRFVTLKTGFTCMELLTTGTSTETKPYEKSRLSGVRKMGFGIWSRDRHRDLKAT